jgi:hypothetical protein
MIVSDWKRSFCLCLALVAWLFPALAQAETGADEAARHFERALSHADALEFDAALVEFQKAYELSPHYSVNYNIGLACAASGRALSAVQAFQRYLDEGGAEGPPERRTRVTTLIKTERPKIARLALDVQPQSAKATLDGKSVSFPPEGLELDPGRHTVVLEAPGRGERTFSVTLRPGEFSQLSAALDEVSTRELELRCDVPDVAIEVDGKSTGQASDGAHPVSLTLPPHARELGLHRAGYRDELIPLGGAARALDCRMTPLAESRTARLTLRLSESRAQVLLDGAPFRGERQVPGRHRLLVQHAGFEAYSRMVTLGEGQVLELDVELVPTAEYRRRYESRARTQRHGAYGLGIAGLGAAIGAVVTGVYSNHLYDEWRETQQNLPPSGVPLSSAQSHTQAENDERKQRIETLDRFTVGLGVASALFLGTAVWLDLTGDDPNRYGKSGSLAVGLTGSNVALSGAF